MIGEGSSASQLVILEMDQASPHFLFVCLFFLLSSFSGRSSLPHPSFISSSSFHFCSSFSSSFRLFCLSVDPMKNQEMLILQRSSSSYFSSFCLFSALYWGRNCWMKRMWAISYCWMQGKNLG